MSFGRLGRLLVLLSAMGISMHAVASGMGERPMYRNPMAVLLKENHSGHNGLDHLWSDRTDRLQPFVVGETKSSPSGALPLLAALPAEMQEKFNAFREHEDNNRTTTNNKPNIFENEQRDKHANRSVAIGGSSKDGK